MAVIERGELLRQYQLIADFIEETEFEAHILEENPAVPVPTLIVGVPEEIKEGRYIACNLIPLPEDESAYTNFLQMFYEVPYEVSEINELELLRAVNAINGVMPVGHFIMNQMSEKKARVQCRVIVTADVEEELNPSTVCECACMILRYGAVMEEMIAGLQAGMDLAQILQAEGIA